MRTTKINRKYYKRESRWYDLTRSLFLFGRNELIELLGEKYTLDKKEDLTIMEVGCGTGYMEKLLRDVGFDGRYIGIDISPDMLKRADSSHPKTMFILSDIDNLINKYDIILFSYPLTLIADWQALLNKSIARVDENGCLMVVDFHRSKSSLYSKYMGLHSVGIGQGTKQWLDSRLTPIESIVKSSPYGLWEYFFGIWKKVN